MTYVHCTMLLRKGARTSGRSKKPGPSAHAGRDQGGAAVFYTRPAESLFGATYCLRYSTSPVMFWFLISPAMRPASFSAPGMLVWVASVPIA